MTKYSNEFKIQGETIFNLMKRECLNRLKIGSLEEMKEVLSNYVTWFNNIRRSNKLKYTTPVKYKIQKSCIIKYLKFYKMSNFFIALHFSLLSSELFYKQFYGV